MRKTFGLIMAGTILLASCVGDLNVTPIDPNIETADKVYKDVNAYRQVLAKCYAGYALSGQEGPAGSGDIGGLDEGFGQYLRGLFYLSEFPTDEAVIAWNDQTIYDFHNLNWTSSDGFISAFYSRVFYQISLCSEFIREADDEKLSARNISGTDAETVRTYKQEARFLRAFSYFHAIDNFGNVPFITEDNKVGGDAPTQISRAKLFDYIESELLDIESKMVDPKSNEYGRADKAAVWALLAKLYLNAEVYTGISKYNECVTFCNKIIDAGYSLEPEYRNMFLADNHLCKDNEFIFTIRFDGVNTISYGGMNFVIFAMVGGKMPAAEFGISSGWGGYRTTPEFVDKFPADDGSIDKRAMFHKSGQTKEINNVGEFTEGYAYAKYRNVTRSGERGSADSYVDTDFPVFRLADVYLMYAEAVLRGASNGTNSNALNYVNQVRTRAYGDNTGNIGSSEMTLDFILDERGRELYLECQRRTDLVRFNKLTTDDYLWAWKGGLKEGRSVNQKYNLYPIPSADIMSNPGLDQNSGY